MLTGDRLSFSVHKITRYVGYLSLIICFSVIALVVHESRSLTFGPIVLYGITASALGVLVTLLLLYGERKKKPVFYYPYLLATTYNTVALFSEFTRNFFYGSFMFFYPQEGSDYGPSLSVRFGLSLIWLVSSALLGYFGVYIPNRSRILLKKELKQSKKDETCGTGEKTVLESIA